MSTPHPPLERVLVTNDDGIDAPGLQVAIQVAGAIAREVWVAAPLGDCSGMSRLVSLHSPLRIQSLGERRVAVTGSPSDCVIIGLRHLMREHPPALVLSGVNAGANHSREVGYSGTVGAALTARTLGVPGVALSQAWRRRDQVPWETSRAWLPRVLTRLIEREAWIEEAVLNVNVPCVSPSEITGVEVTRLGTAQRLDVDVIERVDRRDKDYYWLEFKRFQPEEAPDTDVAALKRKAISVTPIGLDHTDHHQARSLRQRLDG